MKEDKPSIFHRHLMNFRWQLPDHLLPSNRRNLKRDLTIHRSGEGKKFAIINQFHIDSNRSKAFFPPLARRVLSHDGWRMGAVNCRVPGCNLEMITILWKF